MLNTKLRIQAECKKQEISISKLLMAANIQSGDYYQAVNGKKPFFNGWKIRVAKVLKVSVEDLFPLNKEVY